MQHYGLYRHGIMVTDPGCITLQCTAAGCRTEHLMPGDYSRSDTAWSFIT